MLDIVVGVAAIVFLVCFIIVLRKAFKDSPIQAALCLFVPLYVVYYAFARLESEKKNQLGAALVVSLLLGPGLALVSQRHAESSIDDACKFLAKSDAEEALGEKVGEAERTVSESKVKMCSYVAIERPQRGASIGFFPTCEGLEELGQEAREEGRSVSGVGDHAFWVKSSLVVRQQDTCFMILIAEPAEGPNREVQLAASKMLARKAIGQLSGSH